MLFQTPLVPARLIRRYKRFLADCRLPDGTEITAHCPNPGSMAGLAAPGTRVWLEPNDDPARKLKFGWRLVDHENGHFTGIDTGAANRIVAEALQDQGIDALAAYRQVRPEVKYGNKSRIDFLLTGPHLPDAYLEVKSVTLARRPGRAEFPDSVTTRGARHLKDLAEMATLGHRAILLYLVQRTDCADVGIAGDIDPDYAAAFDAACTAGVEVIAHATRITPDALRLGLPLPVAREAVT
jgi:sugar fermentation stimulation protein A